MTTIDVFAHEVCDVSARGEDVRWIFYPGACSRGKTFTLNLVRTESPTHTEVRVFPVFFILPAEIFSLRKFCEKWVKPT